MPMNLSNVRTGLKDRLSTVAGIRAYDTVPDAINTPAAIVTVESMTYDRAFGRGLDELELTLVVVTGSISERTAQNKLDSYLSNGTSSMKAAIESDKSLGGNASDARVESAQNYGSYTYNGITYLGVSFTVRVFG